MRMQDLLTMKSFQASSLSIPEFLVLETELALLSLYP
jgi:hypothetical protein